MKEDRGEGSENDEEQYPGQFENSPTPKKKRPCLRNDAVVKIGAEQKSSIDDDDDEEESKSEEQVSN